MGIDPYEQQLAGALAAADGRRRQVAVLLDERVTRMRDQVREHGETQSWAKEVADLAEAAKCTTPEQVFLAEVFGEALLRLAARQSPAVADGRRRQVAVLLDERVTRMRDQVRKHGETQSWAKEGVALLKAARCTTPRQQFLVEVLNEALLRLAARER